MEPPIIMMRLSLRKVAGSLSMAAPTFISGPMAMSVIWPGLRRIWSGRKAAAAGGEGLAKRPASAERRWVKGPFGGDGRPAATGMGRRAAYGTEAAESMTR